MSGVYQRNREVSEYKFFTQAIAIRVEVNKLMASSSVVPKAYRLLNAVPTVETARSIVYNVNRADCFYPNSSFNALERKRYLTLAIADCEQLMLDMQCLMDIGLPVNANRFEALAGMVEEEIKLLKGARKNVRVTGKKTTEERIAEAEAELERLPFAIMGGGPVLYIGTIDGCVPSWVAPRPTCATSTTTAMPTTARRRTPGFAPALDSLTARPSRPAGRKQSAERKEGATIGHEPVNTHPARVAGRCLHGAALRGSAALHGHASSGCRSHIESRAGCLL